jgi:hypothetical protein
VNEVFAEFATPVQILAVVRKLSSYGVKTPYSIIMLMDLLESILKLKPQSVGMRLRDGVRRLSPRDLGR